MRKLAWILLVVALCCVAAGAARADTLYVVQPGDSLYRIAQRFGVSVSALVAANALPNPNLIYAGQVLTIPGPGGELPAPASPGRYVVRLGDTLWRIAQRFGVSVQALMTANGLTTTRIYAGQVLILPGSASAPTPQPSPTAPATPPPAATPCGYRWFLSYPPANACPATEPLLTFAAAERFERGLMVWLSQTDTFYIFLNRPTPEQAARLTIVVGPLRIRPGGSVDNRVGGAPPGLFEPVSGFGLLWRGEAEQYPLALRAELGWAVEAEHGFEAAVQCQSYPGTSYASPACFMRGPSDEILHYYYVRYFGSFWEGW